MGTTEGGKEVWTYALGAMEVLEEDVREALALAVHREVVLAAGLVLDEQQVRNHTMEILKRLQDCGTICKKNLDGRSGHSGRRLRVMS